MTDPTSPPSPSPTKPSAARRLIRFFDPAESGFVGRMLRLALAMIGLVLCGLCALALQWSQTPTGRYWTGVIALQVGDNERAERVAAGLVADYPDRTFQYYRLWAAALRRGGKDEAQLEVFDAATRAFPDDWQVQNNRCWYGALFGDPRAALPYCDKAISLAPVGEDQPFGRRAVARALAGDRAGAIADLETQIDQWDRLGYSGNRYRSRAVWLETLRAGGNPFDEETLDRLRAAF